MFFRGQAEGKEVCFGYCQVFLYYLKAFIVVALHFDYIWTIDFGLKESLRRILISLAATFFQAVPDIMIGGIFFLGVVSILGISVSELVSPGVEVDVICFMLRLIFRGGCLDPDTEDSSEVDSALKSGEGRIDAGVTLVFLVVVDDGELLLGFL